MSDKTLGQLVETSKRRLNMHPGSVQTTDFVTTTLDTLYARHAALLALVDGMAALLRSAEFRGDLLKIEDCAVALRAYADLKEGGDS